MFDLKKAADSKTYCDEVKGIAKANGIETTGLSTHLRGQLVAVNPAYDEAGVDVGYEIEPGEDVFDGATFEMFRDALKGHKRCRINYDPFHFVLMQLDYLEFIDIYRERICAFHVKDAECNPHGRQGVYSGYQPWLKRLLGL